MAKVPSENRFKTIYKVSIIGILANILLASFKAIVGLLSNSIAITLDAVNNFTDAGSSLITILGAHFAKKEPDKEHPFGHGRSEYIATMLIAGLILYAGLTSFIESIKKLLNPSEPNYSTITLVVVIAAIFVKIFLGFFVSKKGNDINSDSLKASGKDALFDALISTATLVAALVYMLWKIELENWLGLIIAIVIIKSGVEMVREIISKILGEGAEPDLVLQIKNLIASHEGVQGAYDLVLNNYGPDSYIASVHIEVPDTMSVNEFDELSRHLEEEVFKTYGVFLSAIGVYAISSDPDVVAAREKVRKLVLSVKYVKQLHGFFYDIPGKYMRFDMVISFDAPSRRAVFEEAFDLVKKAFPGVKMNIGMDCDFNELKSE